MAAANTSVATNLIGRRIQIETQPAAVPLQRYAGWRGTISAVYQDSKRELRLLVVFDNGEGQVELYARWEGCFVIAS